MSIAMCFRSSFLRAALAGMTVVTLLLSAPPPRPSSLQRALSMVSETSLRANLAFLSSDALAGRWTASSGLDVAAEFIASRFREVGVTPGNQDSYFQLADLTELAKTSSGVKNRVLPRQILARNVIGLIPGSDPELRNSYIIVSAHYDHIGTLETAGRMGMDHEANHGDRIFNGANDDGSGTVSLIEIGRALARSSKRPKRSVVLIAFCGEEWGLLGSRYYVQHPVFPLSKTLADINIEQVGRSDSDIGKGNITATGLAFSDITTAIQQAAEQERLKFVQTKENVPYFRASDNYPFATVGVPDLTVATSYEFPDYHGLKDEWGRIDFAEMAAVDRALVRAIWRMADSQKAPQWNASEPQTASFREAQRKQSR